MTRRGWAGDPPDTDDDAIDRILGATRRCIDRDPASAGISEVARELGVTRQTVYRYFPTTEALLIATAFDAGKNFVARYEAHFAGHQLTPADAVVEGIAYSVECLPVEPYLGLLYRPSRLSFRPDFTTDEARSLSRDMLDRSPVDWAAHGYTSTDLEELIELTLRISESLIIHPGDPPRNGDELRRYLRRWIAPALSGSVPSTIAPAPDDGQPASWSSISSTL